MLETTIEMMPDFGSKYYLLEKSEGGDVQIFGMFHNSVDNPQPTITVVGISGGETVVIEHDPNNNAAYQDIYRIYDNKGVLTGELK